MLCECVPKMMFTYLVTDLKSIFNPRDEKSTLLSRVSTLQAQQAALENRLDSVSQTADNAMEREREAEDRLDAALSMHARQLTQRQV
jgi:outer membrane murein-binding lipoprotein Lpp